MMGSWEVLQESMGSYRAAQVMLKNEKEGLRFKKLFSINVHESKAL